MLAKNIDKPNTVRLNNIATRISKKIEQFEYNGVLITDFHYKLKLLLILKHISIKNVLFKINLNVIDIMRKKKICNMRKDDFFSFFF